MLPRKSLLPLAVAGALIMAAPAAAANGPGPVAHAAGDEAPPPIPSLVQTRLTRVENALGRLTDFVDDGDAAGVQRTGKVIRRQLAAAWRGAVYYIKNPPPVPAEEGDEPVPGAVADQYATTAAVFGAYHDTAATIGQLTDGARVPVLDVMSRTLFWTLDARDKAVAQVHTLDVPPVEEEPEGGEDAASFATVMPTVTPQLDDEIQQIRGLQADAKDLRPGATKVLRSALVQSILTENMINTYWPVVIEG